MSESRYCERAAAEDLRHDVACTWVGHIGTCGDPYADRVLPDGCADIIWDGRRLFVAGPDTRPVTVIVSLGTTFIGIRFRPGHARTGLGMPVAELRDRQPDLGDVWGDRARDALGEQLVRASESSDITAALEQAVRTQIRGADPTEPMIDALVGALADGQFGGHGLVSRLADVFGVTERSLHRLSTAAVGYGVKTLDRVLRLRRAMELGRSPGALRSLGELAVTAGYADHAHFVRDCRRLAGQTPSELFKTAT